MKLLSPTVLDPSTDLSTRGCRGRAWVMAVVKLVNILLSTAQNQETTRHAK
jgi:hypothetical protein